MLLLLLEEEEEDKIGDVEERFGEVEVPVEGLFVLFGVGSGDFLVTRSRLWRG